MSVSPSVTSSYILRQSLSLNLELATSSGLSSQILLGSACLGTSYTRAAVSTHITKATDSPHHPLIFLGILGI